MVAKRKVANLLALAVLSVIIERPMHRYEIAASIKSRGKDQDMGVKWGSLYTVVQNMEKAGFLEIVGSERAGARPERVIYRITDAGRAELIDWARELIAEPAPEVSRFVAGLSISAVVQPDELIELLDRRIAALDEQIASARQTLDKYSGTLPRLFLIETEYGMSMLAAELAWVRGFRAELVSGTFPDLAFWRRFHAHDIEPGDVARMVEEGRPLE